MVLVAAIGGAWAITGVRHAHARSRTEAKHQKTAKVLGASYTSDHSSAPNEKRNKAHHHHQSHKHQARSAGKAFSLSLGKAAKSLAKWDPVKTVAWIPSSASSGGHKKGSNTLVSASGPSSHPGNSGSKGGKSQPGSGSHQDPGGGKPGNGGNGPGSTPPPVEPTPTDEPPTPEPTATPTPTEEPTPDPTPDPTDLPSPEPPLPT